MACPGCLPADCKCVAVVVTETLDDVRGHYDASHAALVVSLTDADRGQRSLGYARVCVAAPGAPARLDGIAVALGTRDGAPDPVCIVIDGDPAPGVIQVSRSYLPALLHVDPAHGHCTMQSLQPGAPQAEHVDVIDIAADDAELVDLGPVDIDPELFADHEE